MKANIVTIKNTQLGKSEALGFWAKHPEVMDAIYESSDDDYMGKDEDLNKNFPSELSGLAINNRDLLVLIIEQAEASVARLDKALKSSLSASLKPFGTCLLTRHSEWGDKVRMKHSDGRRARRLHPMEFGWGYPTEGNKLRLDCWIWVPGGRTAERRVFDYLCGEIGNTHPKLCAAARLTNYRSGTIRLATIPIEGDESFGLDLDALAISAMKHFNWINSSRVNKLFELQNPD